MIHRIQRAEVIQKTFEPDPEIYNNIRFTLTPVKDVVLRFHKDIHDSIFSNPFHENQEIIWDTDDPMFKLIKIPVAPQEILVQRILEQSGKLTVVKPDSTVVKPDSLKEKVIEAARNVINAHSC